MSQAKLDITQWKSVGKGYYNAIYRSPDGLQVLKLQINDSVTDTPERSVRIWKELNPDLPASVVDVAGANKSQGWICPYVEGNPPSDQELSDCLIDIFNKTGRIVCDAFVAKSPNFIKTSSGRVVCIDVGWALDLEIRDPVTSVGGRIRRKSQTSVDVWARYVGYFSKKYFPTINLEVPQTSQTLQALVFIKKYRPDILNVAFLKQFPNLAAQLSGALKKAEGLESILENLDKIAPSKTASTTVSTAAASAPPSTAAASAASVTTSSVTANATALSATAAASAVSIVASSTGFFNPKPKEQDGKQQENTCKF